MIRHDNTVHAGVHRRVGTMDFLDALEHDKSVSVLVQDRNVRRQAWKGSRAAKHGMQREPARCRRGTHPNRTGNLGAHPAKAQGRRCPSVARRPIRRTDFDANSRYEGQVGSIEVVWAPAEKVSGVEAAT